MGKKYLAIWRDIWLAQDKKCAACGKEVALGDTAKSSHSFKVVCQDCYAKPRTLSMVVLDEWASNRTRLLAP